jgi:hypothetical protein
LREDTGKPIGLTVNVSYNDPGFSPGGPPQDSGQPKKKPEMDAFGGGVMAGNEYLVGERGPELFRPAVPGTVIPNNITQNYFNLSMTSQQSTGSLQRDFGVMAAFGRA